MIRAAACCWFFFTAAAAFAAEGDVLKPRVVDWMSETIRAISFNSDGSVLAVSPKDNDFWLADPSTAKKTKDIKAERGPTTAMFAGPTPDLLYTADGSGLRVVNLKSGDTVGTHGLSQGVTGNGFVSANGNYFGFGSASGGIELYPTSLKESLGTLSPKGPPGTGADFKCTAAAMSADGKYAAAGRPNGKLFLFTVEGSEQQSDLPLKGHDGAIDGVAFTKAGLVSLGRDGKVKWWNLDGSEAAVHSFDTPLTRGWLLADGQVAAIVRKPGIGEIQLHRLPAKPGEATKLIGTINIAEVFDGFPLRFREIETQHLALAPNGKYLAAAVQAGQEGLTNSRVAIYDVADIMPKLTPPVVASAIDTPKTPAGTNPPKPTPAPKPEAEARTWKTSDGMFTVEASFVSFANGTVKLKRKDNGKVISVPLKNLSLEDQDYIKSKR